MSIHISHNEENFLEPTLPKNVMEDSTKEFAFLQEDQFVFFVPFGVNCVENRKPYI